MKGKEQEVKSMDPFKVLDGIIDTYKRLLGSNLVGIYLHGSLAMGCYTTSSDIDSLVVIKEPIDIKTKQALIRELLFIEDVPKKGIEMSIILEKYAKKFVYPTPFELHYSDWHRDRYLSDDKYICGGVTDFDLAAHMMIIKHRGKCLYGKEIDRTFSDVPRKFYIESILHDIQNAKEDIVDEPTYMILNLCRVLYYLKENVICSKLEGGNWGKECLPQRFRGLVDDAISVYMDRINRLRYDCEVLIEFAEYMLHQIKAYHDSGR